MKEILLERFLRYTRFDTASAYDSSTYPSTQKQWALLEALRGELTAIGCLEVELDKYGYLTATIPSSAGLEGEPVIGFLAHVDTSPDASGCDVRAQVIHNYDPLRPIALGDSGLSLSLEQTPELALLADHTLVTTDGRTLLGADDKAGVAAIVTAAEYLIGRPEVRHGKIRLGFTPDEEIGRGVDFFDVQKFGAAFAYTVDSGGEGCVEFENFNAAKAVVTACGHNIHPGYAKGKMVNALETLAKIHSGLPADQKPENTELREGFFHIVSFEGSVDKACAKYIIRDHSDEHFALRKALISELAGQYGATIVIEDQYRNMRSVIEPQMQIVERAVSAIRRAGAKELVLPIRGGTDGARLSYMGLPCPNIFTGAINVHSVEEFASIDSMLKAVFSVVYIAQVE